MRYYYVRWLRVWLLGPVRAVHTCTGDEITGAHMSTPACSFMLFGLLLLAGAGSGRNRTLLALEDFMSSETVDVGTRDQFIANITAMTTATEFNSEAAGVCVARWSSSLAVIPTCVVAPRSPSIMTYLVHAWSSSTPISKRTD